MNKLVLLSALFIISINTKAQDLYDINTITEIKIYFDDPNWDATMDTYYSNDLDELLYGSCTINGVSYDSIGVTYKGNSTYNASNLKNPMKIKLAEVYNFQNYQGRSTLKFSNGDKDPSFVREVLSYEIGRDYMEMPLSNYAKIYVNDNYYGLFSSSESINGDFMEDRFYCNDNNTRIKCNPVSVSDGSSLTYLGTDSTQYYNFYELKSDFGWTDLLNLCNQIQNNPSGIESYLDVDDALWMLAFNNVLVNLDSYTGPFRQNYYLIMDDNGIFHTVIWDLNQSIGSFGMVDLPGGGPPSPPSLTDLTQMDPYIRETATEFPLIYYLFANSRYKKMYLAHCRTILAEHFSNGDYYTRAQELQTIIDAEVQAEPNPMYTYAQFTGNMDSQQGSGMGGGIYGLSEVMGPRTTYLESHADFNLTTPVITGITPTPTAPVAYDVVTFTADIQNANYAYVGFRSYKGDPFQKVEMFDDGLHSDGAAGDGIWGTSITLGASDIQYYIYAENNDAGMFSPVRAEHEFYTLTLSSGVVINEIMPSNNITASDEFGEFDDWVELYNNGSSTVDLSGYFLSDDPLDILKWQIPLGTSIGAGEYLIIWCDNDGQTGLHTNFKLSSGGETLILSDDAGNPINEVTYPTIPDNGTYGRYFNGTGGFIPMYATYNAENSFTTVGIKEVEESVSFSIYPNPSNDIVNFKINTDESVQVSVYNLRGQLVYQNWHVNADQISVQDWENGLYLLSIPELKLTQKIMVSH
ncbi:CotH kinase family protein [Paracrocinitomix mangrovi]|uniref:CotH kinase family protein n=1 Tax=Paracrocinitomix mangrovi TaxID=2862509 RepID=UPI001C8CFD7F|nr:CotH kinase family protein [Paracrocinitomix mangrovi]UKN03382.1 CotH kinase family protein [Paracrocinitomix mangrovi]